MDSCYESKQIRMAKSICRYAHRGQVDKAGVEYYKHPFHVAEGCESEDAKICGYLHDVMEDTDFPPELIRDIFGDTVFHALLLLRHEKEVPYLDYVRQLRTDPLAREVKRQDLKHNMDLSRLPHPTERDLEKHRLYEQAYELLTGEAPAARKPDTV